MTQITVREARSTFAELIGRANEHHERIVLTNHGKPVAVLIGIDDFESVMETLDVLGDPETMTALAASETDIAEGRVITVAPGTTLDELRRNGE